MYVPKALMGKSTINEILIRKILSNIHNAKEGTVTKSGGKEGGGGREINFSS